MLVLTRVNVFAATDSDLIENVTLIHFNETKQSPESVKGVPSELASGWDQK